MNLFGLVRSDNRLFSFLFYYLQNQDLKYDFISRNHWNQKLVWSVAVSSY